MTKQTGICMRLCLGTWLLLSSFASALAQDDLPAEVRAQTDQVYAALRQQASPKCRVTLPPSVIHSTSKNLAASAAKPGGNVQITVSSGQEAWLALAGSFGERRSESAWNRLLDAMASLGDHSVSDPASLSIWKDFAQDTWGGWKSGFRARIAFTLAHEIGHACLDQLGKPSTTVCEERKIGNVTCSGPKQCDEVAADRYAVDLVQSVAKSQGYARESVLSGLMEMTVLDAAEGRLAGEPDPNSTHPVSVCRHQLLAEQFGFKTISDKYVSRLSSLNGCLEQTDLASELRRLAADPDRVCIFAKSGSIADATTAIRLGGSLDQVKFVTAPLGNALYGSFDAYLDTVESSDKVARVNILSPKHVSFSGDTDLPLNQNTPELGRWKAAIKGEGSRAPARLREELGSRADD